MIGGVPYLRCPACGPAKDPIQFRAHYLGGSLRDAAADLLESGAFRGSRFAMEGELLRSESSAAALATVSALEPGWIQSSSFARIVDPRAEENRSRAWFQGWGSLADARDLLGPLAGRVRTGLSGADGVVLRLLLNPAGAPGALEILSESGVPLQLLQVDSQSLEDHIYFGAPLGMAGRPWDSDLFVLPNGPDGALLWDWVIEAVSPMEESALVVVARSSGAPGPFPELRRITVLLPGRASPLPAAALSRGVASDVRTIRLGDRPEMELARHVLAPAVSSVSRPSLLTIEEDLVVQAVSASRAGDRERLRSLLWEISGTRALSRESRDSILARISVSAADHHGAPSMGATPVVDIPGGSIAMDGRRYLVESRGERRRGSNFSMAIRREVLVSGTPHLLVEVMPDGTEGSAWALMPAASASRSGSTMSFARAAAMAQMGVALAMSPPSLERALPGLLAGTAPVLPPVSVTRLGVHLGALSMPWGRSSSAGTEIWDDPGGPLSLAMVPRAMKIPPQGSGLEVGMAADAGACELASLEDVVSAAAEGIAFLRASAMSSGPFRIEWTRRMAMALWVCGIPVVDESMVDGTTGPMWRPGRILVPAVLSGTGILDLSLLVAGIGIPSGQVDPIGAGLPRGNLLEAFHAAMGPGSPAMAALRYLGLSGRPDIRVASVRYGTFPAACPGVPPWIAAPGSVPVPDEAVHGARSEGIALYVDALVPDPSRESILAARAALEALGVFRGSARVGRSRRTVWILDRDFIDR